MTFEIFLATRYLFARRKGFFLWTTTIISIAGIMLGVATLIVTLAVMTGFREDIRSKILGVQPHIVAMSDGRSLKYPDDEFAGKLSRAKTVKAYSPFIACQVVLRKGTSAVACTLKGVIPELEAKVTDAPLKIKEGYWENISADTTGPGIILGKELARNLGASLGDKVIVFAPERDVIELFGYIPRSNVFTVCGIIETGLYEYDLSLAYTSLQKVQSLLGVKKTISGYGIKVDNFDDADKVSRSLQQQLGGSVWVRSWLSLNRNLFSALKLEKIVMTILLTLITLVAAFTIVSNLILAITQKVNEIGVLRALGATSGSVQRVFMFKGLFTGLIGTVLGTAVGVVLSEILSRTKLISLPADVYYIDKLPVNLSWIDVTLVGAVSILIVLAASIYPSYKASKLDPCEALRLG